MERAAVPSSANTDPAKNALWAEIPAPEAIVTCEFWIVSVELLKEIVLFTWMLSPLKLAFENFIAAFTAIRLFEISVGGLFHVTAELKAMLSLLKFRLYRVPNALLTSTVILLKLVV